jgi:hypothetical protein
MFRFLHTADIHLDSPLRGLSAYEGAPVDLLRTATRRAFSQLVDMAIEEDVDFVVIAGDLYDGDWRDYNTGLFFVREMGRLNQAEIPVLLVYGRRAGIRVLEGIASTTNRQFALVTPIRSRRPSRRVSGEESSYRRGNGGGRTDVPIDRRIHYPREWNTVRDTQRSHRILIVFPPRRMLCIRVGPCHTIFWSRCCRSGGGG